MHRSSLQGFVRSVRFLSWITGIFAAGLITVAVVVVCQMVFLRFVLNENTIWQTDFVTYSLDCGHVHRQPLRADDARPRQRGRAAALSFAARRFALAVFVSLVTLAFCVTVTILAAQLCKEAFDAGWRSDTMWRARLWIPYSSMPIGLGLLSLQAVADLVDLVTGRQPPFGMKPEHTT